VLLWLGGICWLAGRLLVQRARLGRLLSRSAAATDPRLLALVDQVAGQLGLRRPPAVVLTELEGSPFVCGLFRPVLVLPRGLLTALDAGQWRQVLLHELAHLRRRDLWWGWVPEIARLVYFFHPVAHWACARIRLERELACDQLAMALSGGSAADYALVLVQVVSHASLPPALKPAAASSLALDGAAGPATHARPNEEPRT
jgi:beta-lactamase regulating signal transducer with metallopeptidase domain